eukprot:2086574-Prymnesium_polylepis.1
MRRGERAVVGAAAGRGAVRVRAGPGRRAAGREGLGSVGHASINIRYVVQCIEIRYSFGAR